jgi:hypothetical protein
MHVDVWPPVSITGDPALDWIIFFVVAGCCLYWVRALHLAREGVGYFLENVAGASLVFIGSLFLFGTVRQSMNVPQQQGRVILAGLIALLFFIVQQNKKRSRYIPLSIRRAVIARDLKGARFDSRRHHIDHIWPFSLGGSHTLENLRVMDKKKNLKKGSKRPPFKDMW